MLLLLLLFCASSLSFTLNFYCVLVPESLVCEQRRLQNLWLIFFVCLAKARFPLRFFGAVQFTHLAIDTSLTMEPDGC
uniref:Putative secreted protein n=1 Tax=Anopheles marajoara TaxID=58244 RepID=A0A2M4CDG5_9DIPT